MLQTLKFFPIKSFIAKALLPTTIPNNLQYRNQNTNKIKVRGHLVKGIPLPKKKKKKTIRVALLVIYKGSAFN